MIKNILSQNQLAVFEELKKFPEFSMGGGTALALQIGHRRSIDFDMFTNEEFQNQMVLSRLSNEKISQIIVDEFEQLTLIYSGMKLTFIRYPFPLSEISVHEQIKLIDILTIGAMKAYALGRRAKWKDYIDLYFLIQKYGLDLISEKALNIFGKVFSEKLFREQLCYFDDIDYSERVEYMSGNAVEDGVVKQYLMEAASKL